MSDTILQHLDRFTLLVTIEEKKHQYKDAFRYVFRILWAEGIVVLGMFFMGEVSYRVGGIGDTFLAWTTGFIAGILVILSIVLPVSFFVRMWRQVEVLAVLKKEIEHSQMQLQLLDKYQAHQQFSYGYYREQLSQVIFQFQSSANRNRRLNYSFQVLIILLSLLVTGLTSGFANLIGFTSVSWIAAILSLLVSLCAALVTLFRFHDRGVNLQRTADDIQYEISAADMHIFEYKGLEDGDTLVQLAERVERLRSDQRKRQLLLEQMSQTKQSQDTH